MTTPKDILETKYLQFIADVEEIIQIDKSLFPKISEEEPIEWDMFFDYLDLVFPTADTKFHLKELFEYKKIPITEEHLEKITPIVSKFLKFLEKFQIFLKNN